MKYKEFSSFTDEEIRFIIVDVLKPLKIVKIDRVSDDQINVDVCLMPDSPDYVDTISLFSWGEMKTHEFIFTDEELLKFRQFLCAKGCIPELKDNPYLQTKSKTEKEPDIQSKIAEIKQTVGLRAGNIAVKSIDDLKKCFAKVSTNGCPAEKDGKPMLYRRDDLSQWAKEAFERGEKYFYAEPVNPDKPYGALRLSEPKYVYEFKRRSGLTEEEYAEIFGNED